MELLKLENIKFAYNNELIIDNLNLSVEEGIFTTLLGSSGSGKTTILKLIAGFLEPQSGIIKIDENVVNGILPNKRKVGFVFQDYALFPHLTVEKNLLYGLNLRKNNSEQKKLNKEIVFQTAKTLGIENLLNRFPSELSGGQQQRVALGRSLVLEPKILLMDEPLSSLDTNLRIKVREELREIQERLKITTIYVTHDREEAFSLSDKIAIMQKGKIIQYDSSKNLYFYPKTKFSAVFLGNSNFIEQNDKFFLIRPEWFEIIQKKNIDAENKFDFLCGKIISSNFLGNRIEYKIQISDKKSEEKIVKVDSNSLNKIENGKDVVLKILNKVEIDE